MVEMFIVITN